MQNLFLELGRQEHVYVPMYKDIFGTVLSLFGNRVLLLNVLVIFTIITLQYKHNSFVYTHRFLLTNISRIY